MFVKKRKLRTTSKDMCDCCCNLGCSPYWPPTQAYKKLRKRRAAGLCIACGHKPCKCKSSCSV